MRSVTMMWASAIAVLAAAGAAAAGVSGDRTVVVSDRATQLSASPGFGSELDLHAAFSSGCRSVSVWRLAGAPQTLARPACTSSPYGLSLTGQAAVWATLAQRADGDRVYELWQSETGDSDRRLNPSRSAPYGKPQRIFRRVVPPGAPAPLVLGDEAYWLGGAVRYPGFPPRVDAGFESAPRQLAATDTYLAIQTGARVVQTYGVNTTPNDPPVARVEVAMPIRAFRIDRDELLVLQQGRIQMYSVLPEPTRTFELPAASSYGDDRCFVPRCALAELRLADFEFPYAVYVLGNAVHLLNVNSGRDLVVRRAAATPVHAQMEATGLVYSSGNRITFVGRRGIDALFR